MVPIWLFLLSTKYAFKIVSLICYVQKINESTHLLKTSEPHILEEGFSEPGVISSQTCLAPVLSPLSWCSVENLESGTF